jgi:hypothetical protein
MALDSQAGHVTSLLKELSIFFLGSVSMGTSVQPMKPSSVLV